ncbi:hypothetical protein [Pontibacillus yanchengensis]|uniref:Uncharacterized protein n=1 Tax=Pontibacillus yanchengensis Y32 TaxID=1385514 RepID=A0A0A2TWX4_9BACI|nr:hypothetical protein [Pontibacillus yanchengensis]KGP73755.1 hypothetical protein N782_02395 [Pontibacillus yanchengensis Y32]
MEHITLKKLVKKDLLQQIWLNTDGLVSDLDINKKSFGEILTGNHSWYSDATNNMEDVRISSFAKVLGHLHKMSDLNPDKLASIFSEGVLDRADLLTYLSSIKEKDEYLKEIIKEHKIRFSKIRSSLDKLYHQGKLEEDDLNRGYNELANILDELERESNG